MNYESVLEQTLYRFYQEGLELGLTDVEATIYAYECIDTILRYS